MFGTRSDGVESRISPASVWKMFFVGMNRRQKDRGVWQDLVKAGFCHETMCAVTVFVIVEGGKSAFCFPSCVIELRYDLPHGCTHCLLNCLPWSYACVIFVYLVMAYA